MRTLLFSLVFCAAMFAQQKRIHRAVFHEQDVNFPVSNHVVGSVTLFVGSVTLLNQKLSMD